MAVEVADILRIAARMKLDGIGDLINVYHFVVSIQDLLDDDDVMTAIAKIMDDLYSEINLLIPTNVTYETVDGINVTKSELLPATAWPVLTAGVNVNSMLPEMNAACVFFRTNQPKVRASKFLPPFTEEASVDGALESGAVSACEDFGDFLLLPLTDTDFEMGYVSFNRETMVSTLPTARVVPARYRTQRRRRLGLGS